MRHSWLPSALSYNTGRARNITPYTVRRHDEHDGSRRRRDDDIRDTASFRLAHRPSPHALTAGASKPAAVDGHARARAVRSPRVIAAALVEVLE